MAERERGYLAAARIQIGIGGDAKSVGLLLASSANGAFDLAFSSGLDNDHLQPKAAHRDLGLLDIIPREAWILWIYKDGNPGGAGKELMQQLQPLGNKLGSDKSDPRDVSPRATEANHKTRANRIGGCHEHDRDCLRCSHRGTGGDVNEPTNNRNVGADQWGPHPR